MWGPGPLSVDPYQECGTSGDFKEFGRSGFDKWDGT